MEPTSAATSLIFFDVSSVIYTMSSNVLTFVGEAFRSSGSFW